MKPKDDGMASRRQFVGGVTAGLAAALAAKPAFAQQGGLGPADPHQGPASQGNRIPRHNTRGLPSLRRRRSRRAL